MAAKPLPSRHVLLQLLRYDRRSGSLRWKHRDVPWFEASPTRSAEHIAALWNARYAGTLALWTISANGYREGRLLGVSTKSHRVIWKMLHGTEPEQIDHIDGNRTNNAASNLSAATNATNTKNAKRRKDNTSGVVGVSWYPHQRKHGKWLVKISGKHVGMFDNFDEAVAARRAAEVAYDYHPNHGRP